MKWSHKLQTLKLLWKGLWKKKKKIGNNVEKLKLKAFLIKKSFFKLKLKAKLKNIFFKFSQVALSGKESTCNPLQYSCLENSMDRGAWHGYSPWGGKESDMTEHTHTKLKLRMKQKM